MGIHKILVPIDFSACSNQALAHAVTLSEQYFGASIDVLHVWEPPRFVGAATPVIGRDKAPTTIEQIARVETMKEMDKLLAEHAAKGVVDFHRLHECGEIVPTILEIARRGKYDLVIMGTHGRTGIAHDYLGSVAEKIVRRAPCPVLTFHEKRESHTGAPHLATAEAAAPTK